MAWSEGTLTYGYEARIDLTEIIEKVVENLTGENIDWCLEDTEIVIRQSVKTGYKAWYCRATMESPEEHEVELDKNVEEDDIDSIVYDALKQVVPEMIHTSLEIDDESDWDFPEPYDPYYDDNDAYDRWRDAYYDREYAERGSEE